MTDAHKNLTLYISLLIGVASGCLPDMTIQSFSTVIVFFTLVLGYIIRSKAQKDDLVWHHATFVIRTIWIWSVFLVIAMIGAGLSVHMNADMSAIDSLLNQISSGVIPGESDIEATLHSYLDTNYDLILKTTLMWLAPAQVYAVWRSFKGLSRALKGYRVQNLRSWF